MAKQPSLTLRPVAPGDAERLTAFFLEVAQDTAAVKFFHPHPMTRDKAHALCQDAGARQNRYCIGSYGPCVLAYSMLRGWDEGYAVPSFGGCVSSAFRMLGLGRWLLVQAMRDSRNRGAKKLRLTVYKANVGAVELYRDLGFVYSDKNDHELIGIKDLTGALPACDEAQILHKVAARAVQLRPRLALAGH